MSGLQRQDRDLSRVAEPSSAAMPLNLAKARITPNCHLLRFETAQKHAAFSWAGAEFGRNSFGQVVVRPKPEANPVLGSIERILTKNRALESLERGVLQIQFKASLTNSRFWPDSQIYSLAQQGVSSFCVAGNRIECVAERVPLKCQPVSFILLKKDPVLQAGLVDSLDLKLRATSVESHQVSSQAGFPNILPFVGDFYIRGKKLSDLDLAELGVFKLSYNPVQDSQPAEVGIGKNFELKAPAFMHGGRGVTLPAEGTIRLKPSQHGGWIISEDLFNTQLPSEQRPEFREQPFCAIQWIGCGNSEYRYHAIKREAYKIPTLDVNQVLIEPSLDNLTPQILLAQDLRYANKSGVFLDLVYQENFLATPTGGFAKSGVALERDRLLLEYGAVMSGITLAEYPLFSKVELDRLLGSDSGMVSEGVFVQQRIVLDDTRRLDLFRNKMDPREAKALLESLLIAKYGEANNQTLSEYLVALGATVGKNIAVCFKLGLSVSANQKTTDNLSIYGGIIDPESLSIPENFYARARLGVRWIQDILQVANCADLMTEELLADHIFKDLVKELSKDYPAGERYLNELVPFAAFSDVSIYARLLMAGFLQLELESSKRRIPIVPLVDFALSFPEFYSLLPSAFGRNYQDLLVLKQEIERLGGAQGEMQLLEEDQAISEAWRYLEINYIQLMVHLAVFPQNMWPSGIKSDMVRVIEPV